MSKLFYCYAFVFVALCASCKEVDPMVDPAPQKFQDTLRFASYNVALYGNQEGEVLNDLNTASQNVTLQKIAAVIQTVRPDVLVLMELDYHQDNAIVDAFNGMLNTPVNTSFESIDYPYRYQVPTNTGLLSNIDIDGDGQISLPNDAYGFGNYNGQYASAILSKYPIDIENARSFQKFLWKDLPGPALPLNTDGSDYYSAAVLNEFRLSSKNHIDIPIMLDDNTTVHALISHPTPPVFDGAEDRNGRRNHDELKLWSEYLSGSQVLIDDKGVSGGLAADAEFVLFGDLNADPIDGDSYNNGMSQILGHARIHDAVANGDLRPESLGGAEHNQQAGDQGDPKYDTAFFGLRIDYALPSSGLNPVSSGVFWPGIAEEGHEFVNNSGASDHLLVWVDISFQ